MLYYRFALEREYLMMENLESIKNELSELATVLNAFKSEAVHLRILDLVLGDQSAWETDGAAGRGKNTGGRRPRRATRIKKPGTAAPGKQKRATAGAGGNATLTQMVSGDFFGKPRTINDIVEHCRHNLARTFKANEFSGKLGRMVRNGELTRKKNADHQYEYQKP
jgi:hypothetical protein